MSRVSGFFSTTNSSQYFNFFRDLLKRSLLGQTRNGLQDSLLIRHETIVKRQTIFARETFSRNRAFLLASPLGASSEAFVMVQVREPRKSFQI